MRTFNFCPERQFFGGGGTPQVQQPPAPTPTPTPMNINPVANANERAATLKKMQYGLASTVAAGGMTGTGSNLSPAATPGAGAAKSLGGV
jgi:hypothetical protein